MWYHIRRQFKNRCVLRIGWHCWNLRNFIVYAKRSGECTRMGACLSRGLHRAFSGPQQDTGKECALFLSPCSVRGYWETEWQESSELREQRAPSARDALPRVRTESTGVPPVASPHTGTTGILPVARPYTGTTGILPVVRPHTGTTGVPPVTGAAALVAADWDNGRLVRCNRPYSHSPS